VSICNRTFVDDVTTRRPDVRDRHRRRRADSRRRILDATLSLLEDRAWAEVSLDDVMRRAELSRTAFYRHFDDRELLLPALLDDVGVRLDDVVAIWTESARDPIDALRRALDALTRTWERHGRLLHAVGDAANHNPAIRAAYMELADRMVAVVANRIAAEVAARRSTVSDPQEVGRALVWMNDRYLEALFGRPPLGDSVRASDALAEVWIATVYATTS
jgi:TetR/AcrR family transcriptional regulator, ethionamide resistance regulator